MVDFLLYVLSGLLISIGLIGALLPVVPGPLIGYAGIGLMYFTSEHPFSGSFLLIYGLLTAVVMLLDYLIPAYGARVLKGSRYGVIGCSIGVVSGLFFPPYGFIIGPLVGAIVGELVSGRSVRAALRSGAGSFAGFLAGTGLKLILVASMGYYYLKGLGLF